MKVENQEVGDRYLSYWRRGLLYRGCLNPDLNIPTERGLCQEQVALASPWSDDSGPKPHIVGKPQAYIMNKGPSHLGTKLEETVMVGDNYPDPTFERDWQRLSSHPGSDGLYQGRRSGNFANCSQPCPQKSRWMEFWWKTKLQVISTVLTILFSRHSPDHLYGLAFLSSGDWRLQLEKVVYMKDSQSKF